MKSVKKNPAPVVYQPPPPSWFFTAGSYRLLQPVPWVIDWKKQIEKLKTKL